MKSISYDFSNFTIFDSKMRKYWVKYNVLAASYTEHIINDEYQEFSTKALF